MRILITGATGFVGRNLLPKLFDSNWQDAIALIGRNIEKLQYMAENKNVTIIDQHNNNYKHEIERFNPDTVLHLAAYLTSRDDEESIDMLLESNISYGVHLLDGLKKTQIKNFINIGTFAEYLYGDGNLNSAYLYSATKTAFRSILDYYSMTMKFKVINVIPYSIYGGEDSQKKVIDFIRDSIDSDVAIDMSPGEQVLDFIHIDDVCEFFLQLLEKIETLESSEIFHLGTGVGTSIKDLSNIIGQVYGTHPNINWGGLSYRPNDIMHAVAPISKNVKKLNWRSRISLYDGIKESKVN